MKKTILFTLAAALSLSFLFGQAFDADKVVPANYGKDLDDTTVMAIIKYVGPDASATIDVNSGNLELFSGAEGSEAADTDADDAGSDVEDAGNLAHADCGVATGIDLAANAACDTWGELQDIVNDTKYWRMALVAALYDDALGTAGTNMIDPADSDAKEVNGYAMLSDNSDVGYVSIAVTPFTYKGGYANAGNWFTNDSGTGNVTILDPFEGFLSVVTSWAYIYGDVDTDGGKLRFYEIDQDNMNTAPSTNCLAYEYDLGADDTWAYVTPATIGGPLMFAAGKKVVVRMYTSGTMDADNDLLLQAFMYATNFR